MKKKRAQAAAATEKLQKHHRGLKMKIPDLECFHFSFHLTPELNNSKRKRAVFLTDGTGQHAHAKRLRGNLKKFLNGYRRHEVSHIVKGYSWFLLVEKLGEPYIDIGFFVSKADYTLENGTALADFWIALADPDRPTRSQRTKPVTEAETETETAQDNRAEALAAVLSYNVDFPFSKLSRGNHPRVPPSIGDETPVDITPLHRDQHVNRLIPGARYRQISSNSLLALPRMRCFGCSEHKFNGA